MKTIPLPLSRLLLPSLPVRAAALFAGASLCLAGACALRPSPGVTLGPAHRAAYPQADVADTDRVGEEVQERLGGLEACFQSRRDERPGLAGEIAIHWRIEADGTVFEQCITHDGVGDEGLVRCVNEVVAQAPFTPPRAGGLDVEFPFVFGS